MKRMAGFLLLVAVLGACSGLPSSPPDPATALLEAGEVVALRIPAQLMHGHDMQVPSDDGPNGYEPIPTYSGELLLTDRRFLFVERPTASASGWLAVPYAAVAAARPSPTPLLNYLVLWDHAGHPDSFVVDARHVRALHQQAGQALFARRSDPALASRHAVPAGQ